MNVPILIVGTGGHARRVAQAVQLLGRRIVGFFDESATAVPPQPGATMFDANGLAQLRGTEFLVAVGNAQARERLQGQLVAAGLVPAVIVHPRAYVAADASIGAGTVVLAGAVVESAARIGDGGIVDIGVLVDHDAEIGCYCHIRPGSIVQARRKVADHCIHEER